MGTTQKDQPGLTPQTADTHAQLVRLYRDDEVYRAVVDLYRNVNFEPEEAALWMGRYDMMTYTHEDSGGFRPLVAGYEQRELEFLVGRGVKLA